MKCIDCVYCIRLDDKILQKLYPDYPYLCCVPFMLYSEPDGKSVEIITGQFAFMTQSGVLEESKCKYFKGYDN